jgi:hypothetical protein
MYCCCIYVAAVADLLQLGQVVRGESACTAVASMLQLLQICCSAWRAHVMRVTRPAHARKETYVCVYRDLLMQSWKRAATELQQSCNRMRVQRPPNAGTSVPGGALGERVAALLRLCCSYCSSAAAVAALLQLLQICCSAWSAHVMRAKTKKDLLMHAKSTFFCVRKETYQCMPKRPHYARATAAT